MDPHAIPDVLALPTFPEDLQMTALAAGNSLSVAMKPVGRPPSAIRLACLAPDGAVSWRDAHPPGPTDPAGTWRFDLPEPGRLQRLRVCATDGTGWFLVPEQAAQAWFDRILSTTLDEINLNIRWKGRIDDFPTRLYASLNSFEFHKGQRPDLASYCLAAFGYTALEQEDRPTMKLAFDGLQFLLEHQGGLRGEPLFSFLCHLMHQAVYQQAPLVFEQAYRAAEHAIDQIHEEPVATYNAMVIHVLAGAYFYLLGRRNLSAAALERCDAIFRVAANRYPRDLVKFRELTHLCQRAYWARIGYEASKGQALKPEFGIRSFDTLAVVAGSCRLYGEVPQRRFAARLHDLVKCKIAMRGPSGPSDSPGTGRTP